MNKDEFTDWCRKNSIAPDNRKTIEHIRNSPPSRSVRSGRGVSGRFPSRKMGVTIQFESHKNELPFIYELEHDENVLEYYDQPPRIKLNHSSAKERNFGYMHTPDFFVITQRDAFWVECKTEEQLQKISIEKPHRFQNDGNDNWMCPPGEQHARKHGLTYKVRSSKEINWVFQQNIEFLADYFNDQIEVPANKKAVVFQIVKSIPAIVLEHLLVDIKKSPAEITSDDVYTLIARELLYIDLRSQLLTEPLKTNVFINMATARAYSEVIRTNTTADASYVPTISLKPNTKIIWDNREWTIVNVGLNSVSLVNDQEDATEIPIGIFTEFAGNGSIEGVRSVEIAGIHPQIEKTLQTANSSMLSEANKRLDYVREYLATKEVPENFQRSLRTLQRYAERYKRAEKSYGNGFVGLIDEVNPGNKTRKIAKQQRDLITEFIENEYEQIKQKSMKTVFGSYLLKCDEIKIEPVSYKTFGKEIKRRNKHDQVSARKGSRAAYNLEEFHWNLKQTTPRHGTHPFHYVHIDHTELDIELNDSVTGKNFGRPQLTLLIDTFSRRILAYFITFDAPSYRSSMMVLRECVRRYGRLPQNLIVDGGKDFHSIYLDTLLAVFECTKKTRPPAQSRFGSVMERLFGTTNTEFIHNLQGNTQIMKNVRQVTKYVNPKNHSVWTLPNLYKMCDRYFYEVYDTKRHTTLGESPQEAFERGMMLYGKRSHKLIPYSDEFKLMTLPSVKPETRKVHVGRGIKLNGIYYFCDAFRHPEVENTKVPVRYDPFDTGHVYVYVKNNWIKSLSEYHSVFSGCTEKERLLATDELKKRKGNSTVKFNTTARQLATFLKSAEAEEVLQKQRIADRELKTSLRLVKNKSTSAETFRPYSEVSELTGADTLDIQENMHQQEEESFSNTFKRLGDF